MSSLPENIMRNFNIKSARFEVFTTVEVFWVVMPCSVVVG